MVSYHHHHQHQQHQQHRNQSSSTLTCEMWAPRLRWQPTHSMHTRMPCGMTAQVGPVRAQAMPRAREKQSRNTQTHNHTRRFGGGANELNTVSSLCGIPPTPQSAHLSLPGNAFILSTCSLLPIVESAGGCCFSPHPALSLSLALTHADNTRTRSLSFASFAFDWLSLCTMCNVTKRVHSPSTLCCVQFVKCVRVWIFFSFFCLLVSFLRSQIKTVDTDLFRIFHQFPCKTYIDPAGPANKPDLFLHFLCLLPLPSSFFFFLCLLLLPFPSSLPSSSFLCEIGQLLRRVTQQWHTTKKNGKRNKQPSKQDQPGKQATHSTR